MLSKEMLITEIIKERSYKRYPNATLINVLDLIQVDETEEEEFYGETYDFVLEFITGDGDVGSTFAKDGKYIYMFNQNGEQHIVRLYDIIDEY